MMPQLPHEIPNTNIPEITPAMPDAPVLPNESPEVLPPDTNPPPAEPRPEVKPPEPEPTPGR